MEILLQAQTYNTFGASAIYSWVGDQLTLEMGDYGSAVEFVEITAYLRSPTRNPIPSLESIFDRYHDYLKKLPTITFRRKQRRVEIGFLSEKFDVTNNEQWQPSLENLLVAASEVEQILPMFKKRIQPADDFDVNRFLADAAQVLGRPLASLSDCDRIREKGRVKRQALHAAKSPWDHLEVNWSQFHARARELLDDPFYWESGNDMAPNGNDTGSDLLAEFRIWNKQHPRTSPLVFLDTLLDRWNICPLDWSVTDEQAVKKLDKEQPIPLRVGNEAAIGLAFAVLKMRASCPAAVVDRALAALTRTAILVQEAALDSEVKSAWGAAIAKMTSKLESLPR